VKPPKLLLLEITGLWMMQLNIVCILSILVLFFNYLVTDTELIHSWHEERLHKDTKTLIGISLNIIDEEKQFLPTSPVHTSIVKAATFGIISFL
jgi:hypothetical protein